MSIIIGADVVPVESNSDLFKNGEVNKLIGPDLFELLSGSDYNIFNLEVPLTDHQQPIIKYGPYLCASTDTIVGIKKLGVDLVTLANNHIMDHGVQGLASTIQVLNNEGICFVGAGYCLCEAQRPVFFEVHGKRYGIYACAEHEYSIAKENKPGANPFDPLESLDHVCKMKSQCDYAVVLYHGGKEHYRYPSPNLQRTCRKLIEKGADLVICQHSHCIGCKEEYLGKTIVYGQGNFIFNKHDNEYWNTSLLIELKESGEINYIPIKRLDNGVRLAEGSDAKEILDSFYRRSEEIMQSGFVEKNYKSFADEAISGYIHYFLGIKNGFFYRAINKLSGQRLRKYITNFTVQRRGLGFRSFIECEAHRELLLKGLEQEK